MRPEGFEPPTSWSVARHSIQLSYGRLPTTKCPRQDSNLYAVSGTGPSNQPVYQFQHVGNIQMSPFGATKCSRRDSNPHGVNPHRVLNPARLPSPPPEHSSRAFARRVHGAEGNRTPDLLNAIQALSQLSYGPFHTTQGSHRARRRGGFGISKNQRAGLTRLELATSGVTDRHSNRLSYSPCTQTTRPANCDPAQYPDGELNPDCQVENLVS